MQQEQSENITQLLNRFSKGDNFAINEILPLVYNELRSISSKYLNLEYRKHTLQTTELVHEAYIKLFGNQEICWESRAHFYGVAARAMRQILVDYARKRKAKKRGSGKANVSLDKVEYIVLENDEQVLQLDAALKK